MARSYNTVVESSFVLDTPATVAVDHLEPVPSDPALGHESKGDHPKNTSTDSARSAVQVEDAAFLREAEQAVAMGIITKDEMAAYVLEHKLVAQEEQQRLDDEMTYSLDDDGYDEKQF